MPKSVVVGLKKIKWFFLLLVFCMGSFAGCRLFQDRSGGAFSVGQVWINMDEPDAIILSKNLSELPKDILTIPVINEILTEDLVFYYDNAPSRLSIQGTLNRMAFDHNLSLQEKLVQKILSEPSEFYVWKGETGKPDYWMLVTQNTYWSEFGQVLAKIALNDSQLIEAGKLKIDGSQVPLYALKYQGHTGLFASYKDRLVFLSDAGMLFEQNEKEAKADPIQLEPTYEDKGDETIVTPIPHPKAKPVKGKLLANRAELIEKLLSTNKEKQAVFTQPKQLTNTDKAHTVYFSPALLSLSYHSLMPGFNGVRFDYQQNKWQNLIALTPSLLPENKWDNQTLFQVIPQNAALCGSAPLLWQNMNQNAQKIKPLKEANIDFAQFEGPALSCWFENTPFSAPLFVAKVKTPTVLPEQAEKLITLFNQTIGAKEYTNKARFELEKNQLTDDIIIVKRIVSARYGSQDDEKLPKEMADKLSAQRYFPVTLATAGQYVFFSPDEELVKQAIAVYQKKYPAVADHMKNPNKTLIWINSNQLSNLLKQQMTDILGSSSDMAQVAQTHIHPKLEILAKQPAWAVELTKNTGSEEKLIWLPLTWQAQNKSE